MHNWLNIFCIGFFISLCTLGYAQITLASSEKSFIGNQVSIFEDYNCSLEIREIEENATFYDSQQAVPNFYVSSSCFWLKLELDFSNTDNDEYFVELAQPTISEVEFYLVQNHLIIDSLETGMAVSFDKRRINFSNFIYSLPRKKNGTLTLFIKVKSGDQLQVPIQIHTKPGLLSTFYKQYLWVGLYLGIFLVMILYNGVVWYSTKDKSYLLYVVYITVVGATQLNYQGFLFQAIYPDSPRLAIHVTYLLGALSGATAIIFMREFINTKIHTPKLHHGFSIFILIYVVAIIFSSIGRFNLSYQIIQINAMILSMYMIWVAIRIVRKGIREAKYFLISWSAFLIGVTIFVLKDYGVFEYNKFTYNTMALGSALEVILLSFALADRINQLKKDKELEQAARLAAIEENERIVREQNVFLESKVEERTLELKDSNKELNQTLETLKSAQVQLVDAEKMASLGQMTAGIAHELNNPINFVSSNINPLKRDLNDVFEVLDKYELVSVDSPNLSGILSEIQELKEEIELDYVRKEINDLLNGIEEGASRTAEIVKGLRVFSRLDEDALKKANINDCLSSTIVILESSMGSEVEVIINLDDSIPEVNCFPGKLNQVFMNILVNAVQATKSNDKIQNRGKVQINSSQNDESIFISVEDNGIGMSEETKTHIFDPFFTTKDVGEGTGLGLSIVLGIINDHHGKIHVESIQGEGTKFLITLPKSL